MSLPQVVLKPKKAQPFFARHPWVYAGAIASASGEPADGAEVLLRSSAGNPIARGMWNSQSKIRVRLYGWDADRPLDQDFFRERIESAVRFRHGMLGLGGENAGCRLVFSEADGLSGMIVDRYGAWLTVQFTSLALAQRRDMLGQILVDTLKPRGIYLRTERGIGKLEGLQIQDGLLWGEEAPGPIAIEANGLRWLVNVREGQKTGSYLDQRGNHAAVAAYAHRRTVLDAFCYTGGFALTAARAGASEVLGVDSSEPALALARENARINEIQNASFVQADVFDELARLNEQGRKFGVIVLDPPKFARARHAVPEALRGYRRLQALAMKMLEPDGILVMCCCSGLIAFGMIEEVLAQVAADQHRDVQIVERRGAAPDHPVALSCVETGYLKCIIMRCI